MTNPIQNQPRNRRKATRKAPRGTVRVECRNGACGLGKNLVVQFLDLSEGGVRITVAEDLASSREVEVLIVGLNQGKPIKRLAHVSWSRPLDNGSFCVGLEFEKTLRFQEVTQITRP